MTKRLNQINNSNRRHYYFPSQQQQQQQQEQKITIFFTPRATSSDHLHVLVSFLRFSTLHHN